MRGGIAMKKRLIDYIRDHTQCNYSDIIDYFMDLNECTLEGQDKVKAGNLMDLIMYISEQELIEESI